MSERYHGNKEQFFEELVQRLSKPGDPIPGEAPHDIAARWCVRLLVIGHGLLRHLPAARQFSVQRRVFEELEREVTP